MKDVHLIVFSDYICPWCYVGQTRATKLQKEFNATVEWWPYELHPGLPPEGQPREPRPGPSRPQQMALEEGLTMVQPAITANSKLAQEATEFARALDKGNEFHHAMFAAYWQKGLNISLESVILDVAREVGLDTKKLQTALRDGAYRDALEEKLESARQAGIQAVPSFLINEKFLIEGVYPYEMFTRVVKEHVFGQPASGFQVIERKEGESG